MQATSAGAGAGNDSEPIMWSCGPVREQAARMLGALAGVLESQSSAMHPESGAQ